jgi:hypothetical protein
MDIESSAGVHGALDELLGSSSDNSSGQGSIPVEVPVTGSLTTDSSTISNSTELNAVTNFATRVSSLYSSLIPLVLISVQMTCFLWDEPIWVHHSVERQRRLSADIVSISVPSATFSELTSRLISMVQISSRAIQQALLFIYRARREKKVEEISSHLWQEFSPGWRLFKVFTAALCITNEGKPLKQLTFEL